MPYTEAQKKKAVELYLEHGATYAAKEIGCTRRSVYDWLGVHSAQDEKRAETVARHQTKREQLRELLLDQAIDALAKMKEPHYDYRGKDSNRVEFEEAPADAFRSYATAAAILIDKYRLEMGEHTARTVQEGSEDIDRSVAQLVAELNRRAKAEAEGGALG